MVAQPTRATIIHPGPTRPQEPELAHADRDLADLLVGVDARFPLERDELLGLPQLDLRDHARYHGHRILDGSASGGTAQPAGGRPIATSMWHGNLLLETLNAGIRAGARRAFKCQMHRVRDRYQASSSRVHRGVRPPDDNRIVACPALLEKPPHAGRMGFLGSLS